MTNDTPTPRGFRRTLTAARNAGAGSVTEADSLPLSEWSEARRDILTPQTVAENWQLYVSDSAHALRAALAARVLEVHETDMPTRYPIQEAAAALLRALGEEADPLAGAREGWAALQERAEAEGWDQR